MPKFSIIVPVYRVEKYLRICIDSILAQTYEDYELILVDDGSPDRCGEICEEYALKDSRIKVIHKENGGLSSARNAGLESACGELIYFMDSDDIIKPNLLEDAVLYMTDDVDVWVFSFNFVDESANFLSKRMFKGCSIYLDNFNEEKKSIYISKAICRYKIGWEAWNRVYRRNIIEKNNIRFFNNNDIFAEDLYFFLCYVGYVDHIMVSPKTYYMYRQRIDSIIGMQECNNFKRFMKLSLEVYNYFSKYNKNLSEYFYIICYNLFQYAIKAFNGWNSVVDEVIGLLSENTEENIFIKAQLMKLYNDCRMKQILEICDEDWYFIDYYINKNKCKLNFKLRYSNIKSKIQRVQKYKGCIYILGSDNYGNLGDSAISFSIINFIKSINPNIKIYEIGLNEYKKNKTRLIKNISSRSLIIIPGGGNIGDLYTPIETIRQDIICTWKNNTKIIFPQTISYKHKENIQKAKMVYSKKNNVILYAREDVSYNFAKKNFDCEVNFCPDIVLSQNNISNIRKENTVFLCLRNDYEGIIDKKDIKTIKEIIYSNKLNIKWGDTQSLGPIFPYEREIYLDHIIQKFASAKLVITDRLHGMIFAAITGTPCIALANYNHKLKGGYKYISYLPYIQFIENIKDIDENIKDILNKEYIYDNAPIQHYYNKLKEQLKDLL